MRRLLQLSVVLSAFLVTGAALAQTGPFQYYPLSPCRLVDTRNAVATNGGPGLTTSTRSFVVRGNCGVPTSAKAVSLNVTVTNASSNSWLTIWPSNVSKPFVSMLNYTSADPALANGIIVGLGTATQDLSVANAVGGAHVIIDVTGYFQ
jgi:hypothetical protein